MPLKQNYRLFNESRFCSELMFEKVPLLNSSLLNNAQLSIVSLKRNYAYLSFLYAMIFISGMDFHG
jgi:hypothetical protein